jgi:hypothetical protein
MTAELQIRQDGNSPPVEGCPKDGVVPRPAQAPACVALTPSWRGGVVRTGYGIFM